MIYIIYEIWTILRDVICQIEPISIVLGDLSASIAVLLHLVRLGQLRSQETQHGSQLYRGPHEVWNMGRGSWQIKNVDHWGSRRFSMVWIKTQRPWKPSQYMSISAIIRRSYWFILIKYRRPQLWSIFGYPMSHRIRSQVVGRPLSAKGARVDTRGLGHLGAKDWKVSIFPMQMLWMSFNFLHSFLDLEQQGWTHANLFHSISSQKFGLLGICQSEVWNCEFATCSSRAWPWNLFQYEHFWHSKS